MDRSEQVNAFHMAVIQGAVGSIDAPCTHVVDALNAAGYVIEPDSTNPLTVAEAEALLEEAIARRDSAVNEHTILVAFTVKAPSWEEAQRKLMPVLPEVGWPSPAVTSWWIAEDVRYDGSDNDSAAFVPGSGAAHWSDNYLRRHGSTDVESQRELDDTRPGPDEAAMDALTAMFNDPPSDWSDTVDIISQIITSTGRTIEPEQYVDPGCAHCGGVSH